MLNPWKLTIHFIAMITLIFYLASCREAPIKTDYGNFTPLERMSTEEFKKRQQDPSLMIQESEQDRRAETLKDIKKQDDRIQTDRDKKFNELLDKQLHGQTENK